MPKNKSQASKSSPAILLIMDGWGIAPKNKGNAIALAKKPNFDSFLKLHSNTQLDASGKDVGLPPGQNGNSEAGHMNIGAGRVLDQDAVHISKAINSGQFIKNAAFEAAYKQTQKYKSDLHIMGMLTNGQSGHADFDHLLALITWARYKKIKNVYLHLFTDGRDSPPRSSLKTLESLMRMLKNKETKTSRSGEWVATIIGRYYAMDRKKDWSRTAVAYDAMVNAKGMEAVSPQEAITQSYNRGETDEFVPPYVIKRGGKPIAKIKNNDAVIFFNLRSDRARQLAKPFVQKEFNKLNPGSFRRGRMLKNLVFVAMTDFGPDLDGIYSAFPAEDAMGTLPMALKGKKQLYIAENEKFAHITYFLNGGYANPVAKEDRVMIESPSVPKYDQKPEMSVNKITDRVIAELDNYDFIGINFAIPDMVAHTGNIKAAIKAVEEIDICLGRLKKEILKRKGFLFITSDHGNAEKMLDLKTKEMYTEHTSNPVPFIIVESKKTKRKLSRGKLGDVSPTILKVMDIKKPKQMTGESLF